MAVVTIAPINIPASNVAPPAGVEVVFQASNQTGGGDRFRSTGQEQVIAWNSGVSTRTITVTSVDDRQGRQENVAAVNILAGQYVALPFFAVDGWRNASGYIELTANHADVQFAVLRHPS